MTPNQKSQFFATLTGVCELYGKSATPELLALYWQLLVGYDLMEVQRAFQAHAMNPDTGQFMPKPADVVRHIDGGSQTRAAMAWQKVDKALRCVGAGDSVVFDDPLIHAALATLGQWPTLCATPCDELHFLQARFIKHYQSLAINPPADYPRKLVGRYEAENTQAGFQAAPPALIGDPAQCKQVYLAGVAPATTVRIGSVVDLATSRLNQPARLLGAA